MFDLLETVDRLIAAAVKKKNLWERKLQMSFGEGDAKFSHAWILSRLSLFSTLETDPAIHTVNPLSPHCTVNQSAGHTRSVFVHWG